MGDRMQNLDVFGKVTINRGLGFFLGPLPKNEKPQKEYIDR